MVGFILFETEVKMLTIVVLIALLNPVISDAIGKFGKPFAMNDQDTGSNQSISGRNHNIKKRGSPTFNPNAFVDYHNSKRNAEGGANIIFLKWDDNLARNAKKWIEKCIFDHPLHYVPDILGQNLHFTAGTAKYEDYLSAAQDWYKEKEDYDYATGHCKHVCAHYITMVKWDYTLMGCAVHECPLLLAFDSKFPDAVVVSCEYYSPFKDWPKQPYIKGYKCSQCPEGFNRCQNDLCTMDHPYPIWNDTEIPAKASFVKSPPIIAIIFNSFLVLMSI